MGFYPVCPATDQYVLGAPLFEKITVNLENGKQIVISAPGNSDSNRYVSSVTLNGQNHDQNWFSHTALLQGVLINYKMSPEPNMERGIKSSSFPWSFSDK